MTEAGWRTLKNLAAQIPGTRTRETDREIEFPGGGIVAARSADDPNSLRGESLDGAVLDECAYMKPETWLEAIRPALSDRKGWALFISTPRGRDAFFWQLYGRGLDSAQVDLRSWHFPTASNPHIDPAEIEAARSQLPERIFKQEYLAEFAEDYGGVFRGVDLASVAQPQPAPIPTHRYVAGVDFGRVDDFTVISIFDATTRTQAFIDRFNQIGWELQRGRIIDAFRRWRLTYVLAEANSIGSPNIEALIGAGVPVVPFTTTAQSKAELIDSLALAIERRAAGLSDGVTLLDDPVQRHELEAYAIERLPSGIFRYTASSGEHDDTVIACALGNRATLYGGTLIRFG